MAELTMHVLIRLVLIEEKIRSMHFNRKLVPEIPKASSPAWQSVDGQERNQITLVLSWYKTGRLLWTMTNESESRISYNCKAHE